MRQGTKKGREKGQGYKGREYEKLEFQVKNFGGIYYILHILTSHLEWKTKWNLFGCNRHKYLRHVTACMLE